MDAARIVLLVTHVNRNSLAAVAGALEVTPATAEYPIAVVHGVPALRTELPSLCAGARRTIVAFSFGTLGLIDAALAMRRLREDTTHCNIDNVLFVAGGPHPSAAPEEILKLGFDYVIVGEAEVSFPQLTACLAGGGDPLSIKGVAALREGRLIYPGRPRRTALDAFPPFGRRSMLFSYVEITRGCSRACRFCQTSYLCGRNLRHRSLSKIEESAKFLADVGRRDIHFLSSDALSYGSKAPDQPNLTAVHDLLRRCARIAPGRNLFLGSFPSEVWPAFVTDPALEVLKEYVANDNLIIGAQSGSQRVLDRMHRHHTVQDVVRAVVLIRKWGFIPNVDFILGFPGETESDQQATIRLMQTLADSGATIHSHAFLPLPGTPLADAPPPRLSRHVTKVLDQLAGPGKQYGAWRTQLHMAHKVHAFREQLRSVADIRDWTSDVFSDNVS